MPQLDGTLSIHFYEGGELVSDLTRDLCPMRSNLVRFEAADLALEATPPDQPSAMVTEGRPDVILSQESKYKEFLN